MKNLTTFEIYNVTGAATKDEMIAKLNATEGDCELCCECYWKQIDYSWGTYTCVDLGRAASLETCVQITGGEICCCK